MKTLSTEQQTELQALLEEVAGNFHDHGTLGAGLRYWALELKPKRVRRKTEDGGTTFVENELTSTENVL